jgi:apolipoprotein N-acyltransferase
LIRKNKKKEVMLEQKSQNERRFTPLKVVLLVFVFVAVVSALSWLVMFLWNAILTDVTGVKPLSFWQAAGLLLLAKILFGGWRRRSSPRREAVRSHWKSKWMAMSREERQEAKSRWEAYCRRREADEEEK